MNHFGEKLGTRIAFVIIAFCLLFPLNLSAQEIKEEISNLLNSGDTTRAITMLESEIKLDPSYEYNYLVLGDIYKKQKKYDLAKEQYQKSVDKNKKFFPGLYALSMIQLQQGDLDEAEKNLSNGLKKSKKLDKAMFHNGMAMLHMARGDYNDADSEIRKALIIDSTNAGFYVNLGDVNYHMQIYMLAIDNYAKALKLDTASLDVYFHWAEACLELKDYTCALDKLNIVLRKDSTHADAWKGMAESWLAGFREIADELSAIEARCDELFPDWNVTDLESWQRPAVPPEAVPLGHRPQGAREPRPVASPMRKPQRADRRPRAPLARQKTQPASRHPRQCLPR